jgi:hypothetical protein
MIISHISPTVQKNCGIGNFSLNLNNSINENGINSTIAKLDHMMILNCDLILFQHEFNWITDDVVRKIEYIKRTSKAKLVSFIHTDFKFSDSCNINAVKKLDELTDAYIEMCNGMIDKLNGRPVLSIDCPGYYCEKQIEKTETDQLRCCFNIPCNSYVIGNFSMLGSHRDLFDILLSIIDKYKKEIRNKEIVIFLSSPVNSFSFGNKEISKTLELLNLLVGKKQIVYTRTFYDSSMRFKLMKMCDLIWCWSSANDIKYASASCSDIYCSGTRIVIPDKIQHKAVVEKSRSGNANVVVCNPSLNAFKNIISLQLKSRKRSKHNGYDLSFQSITPKIIDFLKSIC